MPKFIIQDGYRHIGEFSIPEGKTTIGRGDTATFRLKQDKGISRLHCQVMRTKDKVTIEDLNSRNGTFVNSMPIHVPIELRHLDTVQINNILLSYSEDDDKNENTNHDMAPQKSEKDNIDFLVSIVEKLKNNISKVVRGKDDVITKVLIAFLCDGHVLLEDVPGVGKTKLARTLARSLRTVFKRIQFTPDMLPNDITGVSIFNEAIHGFSFIPGPIFGNVILADEINRGTPRVQSSLLESMAEGKVTVDSVSHILNKPFFVIATQNPADFHGTYPLPEAQLDRFLMKLNMGYPDEDAEIDILNNQMTEDPINHIERVTNSNEILLCQNIVRNIHVSPQVKNYIVTLVRETRKHPAFIYGASPRASLALMRASQCQAAMNGRDHVLPRDARDLAVDVLSHRLPLRLQARAEWNNSTNVLQSIIEHLPMERWEKIK
ncbi:MAG: AAA family ATPase [Lentisphaeria bacterium]